MRSFRTEGEDTREDGSDRVARLFGIVQASRAYFGMKDAQQLLVVAAMVRDLAIATTIVPVPIVREPDGLAMSSRNIYLAAAERTAAARISAALEAGAAIYAGGVRKGAAIRDGVSGSGAFIPNSDNFNVEVLLELPRNPDYWKMGADGLALPYLDSTEHHNITDATATEAAWRNKQVDAAAFPLSLVQVQGIMADFPDTHQSRRSFGFTILTGWFNFSEWPGEDGQGNPYLDRRFAMATHMAVDRFQMIDTVYLGDARPSVNGSTPWFDGAWAPPEEELLTWPGWRVDREEDIAELRGLIDASGYDTSRGLNLLIPDIWEGTYPGVTETEQAMFQNAMGFDVTFEVQPYTVILQRLEDGTYPGSGPQWGNPPANLDPSNGWNNGLIPGGSSNFPSWNYDYAPVTELVTKMQTELDMAARQELVREATLILAGQHPEHGLDGIQNTWGVMNGIQRVVAHNYTHVPDDVNGRNVWQFAHAAHHWESIWMDTNHPDYPG